MHLDSALAAAELFITAMEKNKELQEFTTEIFLKAYRGQIEVNIPSSLEWNTEETSYPLGSALIPVYRLTEESLALLLPSEKPHLLHIILEDGRAIPNQIEPFGGLQATVEFHNILPLRKRTNLERLLQLLTAKQLDVTRRGLSQITEARGAYRALDSRIRIEGILSTTAFAAILYVADDKLLYRCLELLKMLGIGKKRDMGYGDLMDYQVLRLARDAEIKLKPTHVEWQEERMRYRITLRLLPWPTIRSWMAQGWRLVRASAIMSSYRPPYWLRGERRTCVLCLLYTSPSPRDRG